MNKKLLVFWLIAFISLQIRTYGKITSRNLKLVDEYRQICLCASGHFKGTNINVKSYENYSIPFKMKEHGFFKYLFKIQLKKIENIFFYFLFFRSFYVDILKTFFLKEKAHIMLNKKKHKLSYLLFAIDFGYGIKKRKTSKRCFCYLNNEEKKNFFGKESENKIDSSCVICLNELQENEMIVAHYSDNNQKIHFTHKNCIQQWLNIKDTCPHCKDKVKVQIGTEDENATITFWQDVFKISLQTIKLRYEYAVSNFNEFSFSFRTSLYPLIFSLRTPTMLFRSFTTENPGVVNEGIDISWRDCFGLPDSLKFYFYGKISIGILLFVKNLGGLLELSYIKTYYKRKVDVNKIFHPDDDINEDNNINKNNVKEDKGFNFEFKITILIK